MLLFKHSFKKKRERERDGNSLDGLIKYPPLGGGGGRSALFPELKVKPKLENKEAIG